MSQTSYIASIESVHEIQDHVKKKISKFHPDESKLFKIDLLIEELVVNIVKYGLKGIKNGFITVKTRVSESRLMLEICDNGIAFNPLDQDSPDLSLKIKDRKPGGLGIFFIKQIARDIQYIRQDHMNIMRLVIDL